MVAYYIFSSEILRARAKSIENYPADRITTYYNYYYYYYYLIDSIQVPPVY